ncbi:ketosamine-3-kinase-like [Theropithecus gelada]|uniref:ketosamine-3-kinase-like n=1 Tax=Theropithecus gelada TaxID=9565 RepID=UPI000DC1705D|nr:ketosamine-3-kinase-like [Theropithecus gelada]
MFEGEMASLTAILKTNTVRVPKPIKVLDAPGGGSVLVMEHVDMRHLSSHAAKLGAQLADLHLENKKRGETLLKEAGTVGMALRGPWVLLPRGGRSARVGSGGAVQQPWEGRTWADARARERQARAASQCTEHGECDASVVS